MKRGWIAGVLVAALAGPAQAKPDEDDFWASLIAPNAEEIDLVLRHARTLRQEAMQIVGSYDPAYSGVYEETQREMRQLRLEDAYGMLRYARRKLDPDHPEVLYELGRTADDIGRFDEALEVLEHFIEVVERKDRRIPEAHIRIGRIQARFGEWDEAIASFKRSLLGKGSLHRGIALLYLGSAHMHNGQLAEAIDALTQATELQGLGSHQYYFPQVAQFALAVAYDRDEQISRSHETLEKVLATDRTLAIVLGYPNYYGGTDSLEAIPLMLPPHERHYYLALKYEASGLLEDARAEWLAYTQAADEGAARDRARAHIADLDEMLDERREGTDNGTKATPAAKVKLKKRRRRPKP